MRFLRDENYSINVSGLEHEHFDPHNLEKPGIIYYLDPHYMAVIQSEEKAPIQSINAHN